MDVTTGDADATAALLARARSGRDDDVQALVRRCAGKLVPLVRIRMGRSLRARLESDDLVQACLVKAFQRLDGFRGEDGASLVAWLARIAENEIRDQADFQARQRRDAGRNVPLDEGLPLTACARTALSEVILSEQARRLESALLSLEPDHREVISLRKLEELPFAEVGRRMGRSEDACRMLLARAMAALTVALDDHP